MTMLEGKKAVVTGGATGIGAAVCRRFAAAGAAIAVLDIDGDATIHVDEALVFELFGIEAIAPVLVQ